MLLAVPGWAPDASAQTSGTPSAPLALSVASAVDDVRLDLSWQTPGNSGSGPVTSYRIYRGTDSSSLPFYNQTAATVFADLDVNPGQTYYYKVSAVNAQGEGPKTATVADRTADLDSTLVFREDFDDGSADGWTLTSLWHVSSACVAVPEGTHALMMNIEAQCNFNTGGTVVADARFSVDLTQYDTATLLYDEYFDIEQPGAGDPEFDFMRVYARKNGGPWALLTERSSTQPEQLYWKMHVLDLSPLVGGNVDVRFAFDSRDAAWNEGRGWLLDAVEVRTSISLPQAPGSLSVAGGPDPGALSLSWVQTGAGSASVDYFLVEAASSADGPFSALGNTSQPSFTHTGLGNDVTRFYRVTAHNPAGTGPASSVASGTTWDFPSAPTVLNVSPGPNAGQISIDWSAPADDGGTAITAYVLYRDGAVLDLNASAPFVDADLPNGATHAYSVAAMNAVGEGPQTPQQSGTTFDLPGAPEDFTVSAGPDVGQLTIAWNAPSSDGGTPITGYALYRDGSLADPDAASPFVDTDLGNGATHAYTVAAVNAVGEGPHTGAQSGTTFDLPGVPLDLDVTPGPEGGQLSVSWSAPASDGGTPITGYTLYRDGVGLDVGTNTSFLDDGLGNNTDVSYSVAARNLVGEGPQTSPVGGTTFDLPTVPLALSLAAGPGAGQISLSWTAPVSDGGTPITGYVLYRDGVGIDLDPAESHIDSGLGNGQTVTYALAARNMVGEGPATGPESETTFDVPSVPLNFTVTSGPGVGEITLNWTTPTSDGGTPITGYVLYRDGTPVDLDPQTSFVDDELGNGVTIQYALAARNLAGEGPQTDNANGTSFDFAQPPVGVTAEPGPTTGSLRVSWGAVPDDGGTPVTSLVLYVRDGAGSFQVLQELAPQNTSFVHADLGQNATRTYALAAVNLVGTGPLSAEATATTVFLPGTPGGPVATSGPQAGEVTLEWTVPAPGGSAISAYEIYRGLGADQLALVRTLPAGEAQPSSSMSAMSAQTGDRVQYVDTGLGNGVTFAYAIAAVNDDGAGQRSDPFFGSTFTSSEPPAALPNSTTLTSATFDGRYAYLFGGLEGSRANGTSTDRIVRFDPLTEQTEPLNVTLPSGRHATSSVWVPDVGTGRALVFFGEETHSAAGDITVQDCHPSCGVGVQVGILDTDQNNMQIVPINDTDFVGRHSTSSVYVPPHLDPNGLVLPGTGQVYVFGGEESHHHDLGTHDCHPSCIAGFQILRLNPQDFDHQVMPFPEDEIAPRHGTSAVWVPVRLDATGGVVNGTGAVYIFGGHQDGGNASSAQGELGTMDCHPSCIAGVQILRFNPFNQQMQVLPEQLPTERWYTSAAYDGLFVYIFGGENETTSFDDIIKFDPTTGVVEQVGTLPSGRGGTSAIAAGPTLYVFGGDDGNETTDEVVRYRPLAPQQADAQGGPGDRQLLVTWGPPANAAFAALESYRIYAGAQPDNLTLVASVPATALTYLFDANPQTGGPLERRATWYFKVSAVGSVGEGPQSAEVNATTFDLPSVPLSFHVAQNVVDGTATLQWNASHDDGGTPITQYELWRQEGPFGHQEVLVVGLDLEFVDGSCGAGSVCEYKVRARNLVGPSGWTEVRVAFGTAPPL